MSLIKFISGEIHYVLILSIRPHNLHKNLFNISICEISWIMPTTLNFENLIKNFVFQSNWSSFIHSEIFLPKFDEIITNFHFFVKEF